MKTIIVPTDFSDNASNALHYAASLASAAKARVVLYNAFPYPVVTDVPTEIMQEFVDRIADEQFRKLKEIKQNITRQYGIEVTCIAQAGSVSNDLEEIMEKENGDLAVMGMRGANPAVHILMGSNTAAVLRKGRVPLLIVPPSAGYKSPRRILFACSNPFVDNPNMLRPIREMASLFSAEIEVLMVSEPQSVQKPLQKPRPSNLEEHFRDIKHLYTFDMSDAVRASILDAVHESNADMIAMIPHHHSIWPYLFDNSDTLSVAMQTTVPLLVLAENAVAYAAPAGENAL